MPDYTIRTAVPTDAAGYIRLIKDVLREQPAVDTPYAPDEFNPPVERIRDRITECAISPNDVFIVAEANRKVIGALTCGGGSLAADAHRTELGVYVAKDWRDKGAGSALMTAAMRWAEVSRVVRRVELEVFAENARAIHVYEKFGFVREGLKRGLYRRGGVFMDMVIMSRWFEKA